MLTDKEITDAMHDIHALCSFAMLKPGCERDMDGSKRIKELGFTSKPQGAYIVFESINERGLDALRSLAQAWVNVKQHQEHYSEFWDGVDRSAKEVATWPDWKIDHTTFYDDRCDNCKEFDKDGCPSCGPETIKSVF